MAKEEQCETRRIHKKIISKDEPGRKSRPALNIYTARSA